MINAIDNSLENQSVFGGDILDDSLNSSLGNENTTLGIVSNNGTFSNPFETEKESLSSIEELIISERKNFNTDTNFNNFSAARVGFDSFTGADFSDLQPNISLDSAADTSFAPPASELEFQGGFGDYDGGNDVTLSIEDSEGNVVETYALSGEGQGTVYTDEDYAYLFFSGTNESTEVDIDSQSNIKFGDFVGASLEISTSGNIDGGDVFLNDEDNTEEAGLVLKSGLGEELRPIITGYNYTKLELPGAIESYVYDINDIGEVVGYSTLSDGRKARSFVYRDGTIQDLNITEIGKRSYAYGINNSGTVVGAYDTEDGSRAFSYSGGVSNLGVLEEGKNSHSSARDINNAGQIVGISSVKDLHIDNYLSSHAFLSSGSGMTDLTPSLDYRQKGGAYAINDSGQTVVHSDGQTFIYDGGHTTNLGVLPGESSSLGYGINNLGQVVGISGTRAFLYSDGHMIDLETSAIPGGINNYGDIVANGLLFRNNNGNYTKKVTSLYRATGINDREQIIGLRRKFSGGRFIIESYFLDPIYAEPLQEDYINISNISTVGDSVLLQGGEINLSGEAITTAGGSVTLDGATTVNSSTSEFIFDSSISEEATVTGGDIIFTETLDSNSGGSQSVRFRAGMGNVTFDGNVGDNAPFLDFTVAGAGTLSSKNITVDGNFSLEVINNIETENLSADGLTAISLGKIGEEIYNSTGNLTIGNINTQSLNVLNNGKFTAGEIVSTDGDIEITSLNDLAVDELNATNGAINLISGTAGIDVNGNAKGDNGFVALAQQDIVSNEIISSQDTVILKSSQGAITVNGSITAFDDASIAAANNVMVGAVTSQDSSVALVSATGTVALGGTISTMEDVTVASAQSLTIDQEIRAELGSIALGSTESSVAVSVAIDTAIGVNIAAKQNVSTKRIRTYGGNVVINAEQGTATIGGVINSRGGDIFVSALDRIRTKNLISRSGDVSVVSDSDSVRTGYIRTDRGSRSGDVYLEAARNIKVGSSVDVDGSQYSIYTGDSGVINIAHQRNKSEVRRSPFVIGDTTRSGTLALVNSPVTSPTTIPGGTVQPNPLLIYIEVFRRVLDAGDTAPRHQSEINPITAKPYVDEAELNLVEQLTPGQKRELRKIINSQDPKFAPYVPSDLLNRGRVDTRRECFSSELVGHLGSNPIFSPDIPAEIVEAAGRYATRVSGSPNDYLVINQQGVSAYYDGLVNERGTAASVMPNIAGVPRVVETKYGYSFLNKFIKPEDRLPSGFIRFPGLVHDSTPPSTIQQRIYRDMKAELEGEALVADTCLLSYAAIFSNQQAYQSATELFTFPQTKETSRAIFVYRIRASA